MRLFFLALIIGLIGMQNRGAAEEGKNLPTDVKVTYIANAGFLIQVNNKKVLVDALFKDVENEFYDCPSTELTQRIIDGEGEFAEINLVASTHEHIDNFDEKIVASVLVNHPESKFLSCSKTIDQLGNNSQYQRFKKQLVSITPERMMHIDTVINGIEVRTYRISHGPYFIEDPLTGRKTDLYKFAEHVAFRFTIDGVTIFHCGDSNSNALAEYEQLRLDRDELDFAFLGRGFLYQPQGQGVAIMKKYIQAKHYVIMQIQHEDNEYYKEVAGAVKSELPSIKVFEKESESRTYNITPLQGTLTRH